MYTHNTLLLSLRQHTHTVTPLPVQSSIHGGDAGICSLPDGEQGAARRCCAVRLTFFPGRPLPLSDTCVAAHMMPYMGCVCVCVKFSASAGVQVWNNWVASSVHSRRYLSMPAAEALILYTSTPLLSAASFTPSLGNSPWQSPPHENRPVSLASP